MSSLSRKLLGGVSKVFGLHPDVEKLISGGVRLTNPSRALFPAENLPFASRVIATGLWNYCFFQFYRQFVGPYWVERQYNPEDLSFIPRANSLVSMNLTHRTWLGLRSPAEQTFSMVDPAGALSPVVGYYSLEVAFRVNGRILFPSRNEIEIIHTLKNDLPVSETTYKGKSFTCTWTVSGSPEDDDTVLSVIDYECTDEVDLIIGIRPFNPEGAALIRDLSFQPGIHQGGFIVVNGRPEILLITSPDRTCLSNLEKGDAYLHDDLRTTISCPYGLCTGSFLFRMQGKGSTAFIARSYALKPDSESKKGKSREPSRSTNRLRGLLGRENKNTDNEKNPTLKSNTTAGQTIEDKINLENKPVHRPEPAFQAGDTDFEGLMDSTGEILHPPELSERKTSSRFDIKENDIKDIRTDIEQVCSDWEKNYQRGAKFLCNRSIWNQAARVYSQFLYSLRINDSVTPGIYTYNQFWFRDAAYMLSALSSWNYITETRTVLATYPQRQEKDGFFRSHEGEWDSNGQAIWSLIEFIRLTGDADLLKETYSSIKKGAEWIYRKRRSEKNSRIMPTGFSAEHLGPADHYYWDNFWSLAGLRDAASAASLMGEEKQALAYREELKEYSEEILSVSLPDRQKRGVITAAPGRPVDSGMIGSICMLYPLNLDLFEKAEVQATIETIYNSFFIRGLFFHPIIHSGFNIYLSLQVAQCLFQLGNVSAARSIFKKVLKVRSPMWTYPEAIHPLTGGGVMGDGFHGWAYAELLLLLRNFVFFEKPGSTLEVFRGLRSKELYGGKTEFGPFPIRGTTIFAESEMNSKSGQVRLIIPEIQKTGLKDIHIYLPIISARDHAEKNFSVKVQGAEHVGTDHGILLNAHSDEITIEYASKQ